MHSFIRDVRNIFTYKEMHGQILRAAQRNLLTASCTEQELGQWVFCSPGQILYFVLMQDLWIHVSLQEVLLLGQA